MPEGMEGSEVVADGGASTGTEAAPVESSATSGVGGSTESTPVASQSLDIDSYADHVVTVKVDGEEVTVPLKEALSGYQRQADYTRKTQAIAEAQRQAEAYAQLDAAFRADPKGTIEALARQAGVELGTPSTPIEELDPEEARIARVEAFMQSEQQRRAEEQINSKLDALRGQYGEDNVPEHEFLSYAVQRGFNIDTLDDAFKAFHYDKAITQARAEAEAKVAAAEKEREDAKKGLPPVHGGSHNGGAVVSGEKPASSLRAAWAQAIESLS